MPATTSQGAVKDPYTNGLLSGTKWEEQSLTFAFSENASAYGSYTSSEPSDNFASLTGTERAALREALQEFASVAGLSFTEIGGPEAGGAVLQFAKSDATGTAWAYAPARSEKGGDVWFSNAGDLVGDAQPGNYAWFTMLHEVGHALGLKHPHEAEGAFSAMPKDRDSVEYSVMSYRSFVGAKGMAYGNDDDSYPQSLMMYDIAALQEMYGANYGFRDTDTTYVWSAKAGQLTVNGVAEAQPLGNKVFLTVWDGGGTDTYSFAGYRKSLKIDLAPGAWTVTAKAQLAELGNGQLARGNIANALLHDGNPASLIENAIGGRGNDRISGNQGANTLTGGAGNDKLDGRAGIDAAAYAGKASRYEIEKAKGGWIVTDSRKDGGDGRDRLVDIEVLKFNDRTIALDSAKAKAAAPEAMVMSGAGSKGAAPRDSDGDAPYGDVGSAGSGHQAGSIGPAEIGPAVLQMHDLHL